MTDHRHLAGRRGLLAGVAVLLACWIAAPAHGQSGGQSGRQAKDAFEVRNVAVDVTEETAAAAREKALLDGQVAAYGILLERLTLRADRGRLPDLARVEIAALVKDFEVAKEKTSAVRYIAWLNIRFKAQKVRRLLIDYDLPFAETPSKPVLVLPVFQAAGAKLLFDDPNPWRDAWVARPPTDGLVPLVLPIGDLKDILAIGAEQALSGDVQRLAAVAARYDARDSLVTHGSLRVSERRGLPELEVLATRYGTVQQEQTTVSTYSAGPGESMDALLLRAATDVTRRVEDNWKRDNFLQFGQSSVLAVTVPISGLGAWLDVRGRLINVAVINHVDLLLLSRAEVRVNLHYMGELEQLSLALAQADLIIEEDEDGWILRRAGGVGTGH
jgi:hypothetical protein